MSAESEKALRLATFDLAANLTRVGLVLQGADPDDHELDYHDQLLRIIEDLREISGRLSALIFGTIDDEPQV